MTPSASAGEIIPDPAFIPDFAAWDELSADQAHLSNDATRKSLNTGNLSPGCLIYLDRKREMSIPNEAAFRAVRRLQPPKGQTQARLGNSYEFFRHLESFASYWDDTSKPPASPKHKSDEAVASDIQQGDSEPTTGKTNPQAEDAHPEPSFYRIGSGTQMPPEYRHNLVSAFLKLVAYDFGCNVSAPRIEPRLYITSTVPPTGRGPGHAQPTGPFSRTSYFSSGCSFIFRTPQTRDAARAGIVEGPLAAVTARHSTTFPPPRPAPAAPDPSSTVGPAPPKSQRSFTSDKDSVLDLAREIIAAVLTAQHRAREGQTEKRFGQDAWWVTKPRWGGGPGGPIGREVDTVATPWERAVSDRDSPTPPPPQQLLVPSASASSAVDKSPSRSHSSTPSSSSPSKSAQPAATAKPAEPAPIPISIAMPAAARLDLPTNMRRPVSIGGDGQLAPARGPKRIRKSTGSNPHHLLPMYDGYRALRPPAPVWDKKTRYEAVGRRRGADYDDVFVISALFHHVCILRVRVPDRLLEVLDGAADEGNGKGGRSWGRLEVWRSRWFDFFKEEDRVDGMRLVWCMMSYLMRKGDGEDAKMGNS